MNSIPYDEIQTLANRCNDPQMPEDVRKAAQTVGHWLLNPPAAGDEFRVGLPPLALRKAWSNWQDSDGDHLHFSADGQMFDWTRIDGDELDDVLWMKVSQFDCDFQLKPIGKTWAEVEALAAEVKP